jgi:dolichol-phosphate mannosyltransferase
MKYSYSIIIPAKNELKNLKLILPVIRKKYNHEICLINKSQNKSEETFLKKLTSRLNIRYIEQSGDGKGMALRQAANEASGDFLIFFDADFSHDVNDIEKIISIFSKKKVDHIGGSRLTGGSDELFSSYSHLFRLIGSLIINYTLNFKFDVKLTDSQNGLRGIKKSIFESLKTTSNHTTIEMELVYKTLQKKYNYLEIPTHEYSRKFGKSKIFLWKHSWSYIYRLIIIIFLKKK